MKETKIKALKIEPGLHPYVVELSTDLDSLQKAVSIGTPDQGLIEFVYLEDNVSILCNEEGKLIGLEANRRLGDDILCGVVYVVAENDEGELISLTLEQQVHYTQMFWEPDVIDQDEVSKTIFFRFI